MIRRHFLAAMSAIAAGLTTMLRPMPTKRFEMSVILERDTVPTKGPCAICGEPVKHCHPWWTKDPEKYPDALPLHDGECWAHWSEYGAGSFACDLDSGQDVWINMK